MMISSWSWVFFFHFNYLLRHFPNALLVKIWGAGYQKAPVRASDASSCVRFFVSGYVSRNYKYQAHFRSKTAGMKAWVQTSDLSCDNCLASPPPPFSPMTFQHSNPDFLQRRGNGVADARDVNCKVKTIWLLLICLIWHTKHRGEWPLVLFVCCTRRSRVCATSIQSKCRVSVLEQQTLTRTEQSREQGRVGQGRAGQGRAGPAWDRNSADYRFYWAMAYIKGEHTEPSCWKLQEEHTWICKGGCSCAETCMF